MNIGIERRKIEDKIIDHFNAVAFDASHAAWVNSDRFEDFVFSFFDLRRYYEQNTDTTLGLETMRVYMDGLRALQAAAANRQLNIDRRESAQRLIYELNHQMEAVMYELERNRQQKDSASGKNSDNADGGIPIQS